MSLKKQTKVLGLVAATEVLVLVRYETRCVCCTIPNDVLFSLNLNQIYTDQ